MPADPTGENAALAERISPFEGWAIDANLDTDRAGDGSFASSATDLCFRAWSAATAALRSAPAQDAAGEQHNCFECETPLHGPFCPACNPEMARPTPQPSASSTAGLPTRERARLIVEEVAGEFGYGAWDDDLEDRAVKRILSLLSPQEAETGGWRLVPVEPTEAMLDAAAEARRETPIFISTAAKLRAKGC